MNLSKKQLSILSLILVAFSYALLNVSIRLSNTGFEPFTQVYLRIGLGFLFAVILFRKDVDFKKISKISKKDWLILLLMGIVGYALSVDFVTLAALKTKLLNVSIITSTTPFFIFLYSLFLFPKHINKKMLIYLLISFYGVSIIATKSFIPIIDHFGAGELFALLFAIFLGTYMVGVKLLSNYLTSKEVTVLVLLIAFFASFMFSLFRGEHLTVSGFMSKEALFGILLGGCLNVVATGFENFGFKNLNPVIGSQLMLFENLFAPLFGFFLYHELTSPIELIGAVLIVVAVFGANRVID